MSKRYDYPQSVYAHSRFEGDGAAAAIRNLIDQSLTAWSNAELPDAIVIIRGGGAVNDLAWLDDYELARFIDRGRIAVLEDNGSRREANRSLGRAVFVAGGVTAVSTATRAHTHFGD